MFKEQKQSWNLLESRSFNACINATVLIIVMLNCLEVNTEVSDIGMETTESNGCREISEDDRDTNGMLTVIWERARFFCKNKQKFIDLFMQSINGLY